MSINFILLFLICHVIGDYYLQNQDMAENKNSSFNWVLIHSALYCLPFIIILIFFEKTKFLFCLIVLLCLSHLILDIIKYFAYIYYENIKNGSWKCKRIVLWVKKWMVYVLDQYSAIGFVLTAKSIARYNLISKSQSFAEYYLVGTLYSVLFSVVLYNVIF